MKKNNLNIIYSMILISLLGLGIGSFFDLQINKIFYFRGNIIPEFFKITGEMPMIILTMTSAFFILRNESTKLNKIQIAFLTLVFIAFPIGSALSIQSYYGTINIFITFLISLFYFLISITITKVIKIKSDKFTKYLLFVIISIIAIFFLFNIMKNIWGRMRFHAMILENNFLGFTNWWEINGIPKSESFRSFPSGHTAAAATTLVLTLIPFDPESKTSLFFKYVPVIWTSFTAVSRILDGAHFLTDVSMAIIISGIVIITTYKLIEKY